MITLHGFGENFGVKDPSSLVLKVHTYMQMADINFSCDNSPDNLKIAPKGKLPFINDDGKTIADSQFIFEYLKKNYIDLDAHLNSEQKAQAYLITKSLDENLYFCMVYSRWLCEDTWPVIKQAFFGSLPPIIKSIVPKLVRKKIKRNLVGQGLTKHSNKEIMHITQQSFIALSDLLADKPYFFGDNPSSLDAAAYGILANFIEMNHQNPFNTMARDFPLLVNYCERIKKQYVR
jgi:glutathione S-transferase